MKERRRLTGFKFAEFGVQAVCLDCRFVNPDLWTRSLMSCAVRTGPESVEFCPDKQGKADGEGTA